MNRLVSTGIIGALLLAGGAARASSTGVVVNEVYGGGGNAGAPFGNDFIELRNAGTSPVAIDGWSVQYASASGSSWSVTALPNFTLAPGQRFLVQEASGGASGSPLPLPDAVGTIAMAATAGKIALVASTTALSGACPTGTVDLVGYGTATCFEGSGAAPAPSNTLSDQRSGVDTDDNAADFQALAPAPENSLPTAVAVRFFTATRAGHSVILRWRTGSEVGVLGFDLYRDLSGARVKLNSRLIAARGGFTGASYMLRMRAVASVSRYRLQAVGPGGARRWLALARA